MGKRDWTQKVARSLDSETQFGYQKTLLWIREHKQEILDLASSLKVPTVTIIPGVGNVYGSRVEAAGAIWDKYHDPVEYDLFCKENLQ